MDDAGLLELVMGDRPLSMTPGPGPVTPLLAPNSQELRHEAAGPRPFSEVLQPGEKQVGQARHEIILAQKLSK